MEQAKKRPWRLVSVVLLTAIIGIGFFAIVLRKQGDPMGEAILDFYRNWGFALLFLIGVVNVVGGGPGVEGKRIVLMLRLMVVMLINWGGWALYGG